jgi:hypothetical protein
VPPEVGCESCKGEPIHNVLPLIGLVNGVAELKLVEAVLVSVNALGPESVNIDPLLLANNKSLVEALDVKGDVETVKLEVYKAALENLKFVMYPLNDSPAFEPSFAPILKAPVKAIFDEFATLMIETPSLYTFIVEADLTIAKCTQVFE